jgi:hypothetical protein
MGSGGSLVVTIAQRAFQSTPILLMTHDDTASLREIGSPLRRSIHRHAAALLSNGPAITFP